MQAHALVLNLPAAICAAQASGRSGHEGGVEGPGAQQVSFSVCARLKREGPPSARAEGFQSVIVRTIPRCLSPASRHALCAQCFSRPWLR